MSQNRFSKEDEYHRNGHIDADDLKRLVKTLEDPRCPEQDPALLRHYRKLLKGGYMEERDYV